FHVLAADHVAANGEGLRGFRRRRKVEDHHYQSERPPYRQRKRLRSLSKTRHSFPPRFTSGIGPQVEYGRLREGAGSPAGKSSDPGNRERLAYFRGMVRRAERWNRHGPTARAASLVLASEISPIAVRQMLSQPSILETMRGDNVSTRAKRLVDAASCTENVQRA